MKKAAVLLCVLFAVGSVSMGCSKGKEEQAKGKEEQAKGKEEQAKGKEDQVKSKEDQIKDFSAELLKASKKTDCNEAAKDLEKLMKDSKELRKFIRDTNEEVAIAFMEPKMREAMSQYLDALIAIGFGPCGEDEAVLKALVSGEDVQEME